MPSAPRPVVAETDYQYHYPRTVFSSFSHRGDPLVLGSCSSTAPSKHTRESCTAASPPRGISVHEEIVVVNHTPLPPSLLTTPPVFLSSVRACGWVCQGPKQPAQLRLYSPSSPHPIRLPMKRPNRRPPILSNPHRNESSRRLSVAARQTRCRCLRPQRCRLRPWPTTTIPSRVSYRSAAL